MTKPTLIQLPKIVDLRGNLSFFEHSNQLPFEIARTYWIYDVPGSETRGSQNVADYLFVAGNPAKLIRDVRDLKLRETNNYKSFYYADKIRETRKEFKLKYSCEPKIALMGLAFKPNIDDLRESLAKYIVQRVLQDANDEEYYIVEPNIEEHNIFKLSDYREAVEKADIVAFLVAHEEFFTLDVSEEKLILDFCGIWNPTVK